MKIYIVSDETDKIKTFVSKILRIHFSGFEVIEVSEIPKNKSGKVLYNKL